MYKRQAGGYNIYHVRFGHGVGLSQHGANARAKAGHSYSQILSFYYPTATLSTITVASPQNPVKPDTGSDTPITGVTYPAVGKTTGNVNFRKGPSVAYDKYEQIPNGKQVILYSYESGWYYAYYNGNYGYISSDYVEWVAAANDSMLPNKPDDNTATPAPDPGTDSPDPNIIGYGQVTGSGVNFRSGPGTEYNSYGKLAKGTMLTLYGKSGNWYYAKADNTMGYISTSYVKATSNVVVPNPDEDTSVPDSSISTQQVSLGYVTGSAVNFRTRPSTTGSDIICKLDKNSSLVIYSTDGDWHYAKYGAQTGYISVKYVKITGTTNVVADSNTGSSGNTTTIGMGETTGNVNFRTGPSTSDKKITQLKRGTQITLYSLENGWYRASVNGTDGYVSAKYVKVISQTSGNQGDSGSSAVVNATGQTTAKVNFRDDPSTSSGKIIETFGKGVTVTILGQTDEWYYVSAGGTKGYLYKAYVKITSAGSQGIPTVNLSLIHI